MDNVFSYREGSTFLHTRLHPLTKMVSFLVIVIISGLWLDVRFLLPLFIFGIAMAWVAKVPPKYFLFIVVALGLTWFPTLRSTISQAQPEYFKVLDQAWVATPIATIEVKFLNLGTLGLTYGSLYWLAGREIRFATVVTWAIVFLFTTPISEIANTLYAANVPAPVVFVIQITYKFIPFMAGLISQIQAAQKLRGWNMRTLNPVKLFRRSMPLTNPLMRRTAQLVDQVTTATQIRGFGSGKVTALRDLTLGWLDKIIILVMLLMLVAAVLGLIIFNAGNI